MSKRGELEWVSKLKQWRVRKQLDGQRQQWWLAAGTSWHDNESYEKARAKWEQIKAEMNRPSDTTMRLVDGLVKRAGIGLENLRQLHEQGRISPASLKDRLDLYNMVQAMGAELKGQPRPQASSISVQKTVGDLVELYLEEQKKRNDKRHQIEADQKAGKKVDAPARASISDSRYGNLQIYGGEIQTIHRAEPWDKSEATAASLAKRWRERAEEEMKKGTSHSLYNERMKTMRHFLGWCHENYHLDAMPRNLKGLCATYALQGTSKAIPPGILLDIWNIANDLERAWLLLALNCGYYQKDLSDVQAEWLSSRPGWLDHNRGKTGVNVKYKLWPKTLQYIQKTRIDKGSGNLYVGENGKPLVYRQPGKKRPDRLVKVDIVNTRFDRLCQKLEGEVKISFGNLRDTASTEIENIDRSLTDLFLAHRDARMARYYVDDDHVDCSVLDAAIDKLQDVFKTKYKLPL